jgi:hypothetical protein
MFLFSTVLTSIHNIALIKEVHFNSGGNWRLLIFVEDPKDNKSMNNLNEM